MRAVFSSSWLVTAAADACCCGATVAGVGGDPAGLPRVDGLIACGLADLLRLVDSRVVVDGCFRSGDHDFVVVALDIARVEGQVARGEVEP